MENRDYLKLQYSEGLSQIRAYIDARYKILQFIGFYNAAVLTFGFGQKVISIDNGSFAGVLICALSVLVALMGIATEYSLIRYNGIYYGVVKRVEEMLNNGTLEEVGVFTHGAREIEQYKSYRLFPVNIAHRSFYCLLAMFWAGFLVFQVFTYQ